MRGLVAAAGLFSIALAAPPTALAAEDTSGPLWQISYPGTLLGVAGSAVVFDRYSKKTRQEIVTFDAATGRKRATLGKWRAEVAKGDMLGDAFVVGSLIGGTLYPSFSGLALVDPATDRVRLRSRGKEHGYLDMLFGPSRGPIAVAGTAANGAEIAILGASIGPEDDCGIELRGVDLRTGRRRWRWAPAPVSRCAGLFVTTSANRAIVFSQGRLHAFDLATGRALWQQPSPICDGERCDGLSAFRIATDEEHVAMTVFGRLVVHAATTGELLSRADTRVILPEELLVAGGRIYLASGGDIGCWDTNGHKTWNLRLAGPSRMQVGGDNLYLAAMGIVQAVDPATGTVRWVFGGDRVALTTGTVIIGEDGKGAVAYSDSRPPGPPREVTVRGHVSLAKGSMAWSIGHIRVVVAGTTVSPGADGGYEAKVRLSGGRIAISARGCSGRVGPIYLPLDGRAVFNQDLQLHDNCLD